MGFAERRSNKRKLKACEADAWSGYEHDLGLVISPDDVMKFLDQYSLGGSTRKITHESLDRRLKRTQRRTSRAHGTHILSLSQRAAFAYELPHEVQTLTQGYHLYLGLLAFKKTLRQPLNLTETVITSTAPDIDKRVGVTRLADAAREVNPFFADAARDIILAASTPHQRLIAMQRASEEPEQCDAMLLAAGIGLAGTHAGYVLQQRAEVVEGYRPSGDRDVTD